MCTKFEFQAHAWQLSKRKAFSLKSLKIVVMMQTFILVILSGFGCQDAPPTSSGGDSEVLMPLTIGNSWTYAVTGYDETGNGLKTVELTLNVCRDTIIGGEVWYDLDPNVPFFGFTNKEDGVWWCRPPIPQFLWAKYPASVDDEWEIPGGVTGQVMETDALISVPAGEFVCIHYKIMSLTSDGVVILHNYWSPGVGWIKFEQEVTDPDGNKYIERRQELKEYLIK
jgi:hypothetical protein